MIRLLFWIAIIAVAVWAWRTFKAPKAQPPRASGNTLPMVRCAQCGVHLPSDRALASGTHWYCSRAHLEQGPARRDH
ncbi:PP0621 family protein [Pseudomonas japonica]|uniref:PP0621 family protein n=1 Tax=Pseudomonas japonica TaxID=256466 RepID=UPI0015E278E3|nr:PP0621 family protein [Pseudomonas japonica]MBA1244049.1 hypothetical protein [Pseudomonas japonica]